MRLRIKEALKHYAETTGHKMTQRDLGQIIYPDSSEQSRAINVNRLATGRAKTVNLETLQLICELTGVDPNYLFGF